MTRSEHARAAERWTAEAEKARPWIHFHAKQAQRFFRAGDSRAMGMHGRLAETYEEIFKHARNVAARHQWKAGLSAGQVA